MADRWKQVKEFLERVEKDAGVSPPERITVKARDDMPGYVFQGEELQKLRSGIVDLESTPLINRDDPVRDLLVAIAGAYRDKRDKIDLENLLLAYRSMDVAGAVVARNPREHSGDFDPPVRSGAASYHYPKMHLAGSRLRPVYFTVAAAKDRRTPLHSHPGSEILAVIQGKAQQTMEWPGSSAKSIRFGGGDLLHFDSLQRHSTKNVNKGYRKVLGVWALRELTPPELRSPSALLGKQLRSWRLYHRKSMPKTARTGGGDPTTFERFERDGILPLENRRSPLTYDALRRLIEAYEIGAELLIPFRNRPSNVYVLARSSDLAGRRHDDVASLSGTRTTGVRYHWPRQRLRGSSIHPGLLCVLPFGRTPPHRHPGSEIVLVIQGKAQIYFPQDELQDGDQDVRPGLPETGTTVGELRAGELVHFDASRVHSVINTGETVLRAWVLRELALAAAIV